MGLTPTLLRSKHSVLVRSGVCYVCMYCATRNVMYNRAGGVACAFAYMQMQMQISWFSIRHAVVGWVLGFGFGFEAD